LEKLTHLGPDEMETAESKRTTPKGPTFVFSTCILSVVRSSLVESFFPRKSNAYIRHDKVNNNAQKKQITTAYIEL
jgi:hypothetical protein